MCFEHLETETWLLFEDGYKLGYAKDTVLLLTISCLVVFFIYLLYPPLRAETVFCLIMQYRYKRDSNISQNCWVLRPSWVLKINLVTQNFENFENNWY